MGGGAESVSNNKEGVVVFLIFCDFGFEYAIDFDFTKVSIGFNEWHSQELLKIFIAGAHDWSVILQVDFFAGLDGVDGFYRDVLGVAKTEADDIEDHSSTIIYYYESTNQWINSKSTITIKYFTYPLHPIPFYIKFLFKFQFLFRCNR